MPPPPSNVMVVRTGATTLSVSWEPLTLEEARGFIQSYDVTVERSDARRKRQGDGSMTVDPGQSSVVIGGLDPTAQYSVSVAAVTNAGMGNTTPPIQSPSKPLNILCNDICIGFSIYQHTHIISIVLA